MTSSLIGGIAALIVGSSLAGATLFGLASSQTGAPDVSPVSKDKGTAVIEYGSTN